MSLSISYSVSEAPRNALLCYEPLQLFAEVQSASVPVLSFPYTRMIQNGFVYFGFLLKGVGDSKPLYRPLSDLAIICAVATKCQDVSNETSRHLLKCL
jgi:hypothetical protein